MRVDAERRIASTRLSWSPAKRVEFAQSRATNVTLGATPNQALPKFCGLGSSRELSCACRDREDGVDLSTFPRTTSSRPYTTCDQSTARGSAWAPCVNNASDRATPTAAADLNP